MRKSFSLYLTAALLACSACGRHASPDEATDENLDADRLTICTLQGIWTDEDTRLPQFWIKDDSVFFADSTSVACVMRVSGDTLWLGSDGYHIEAHDSLHLSIVNSLGNALSLRKSQLADDTLAFALRADKLMPVPEVTKSDTVVHYGGRRYHAYVTVNPTTMKVYRTFYTADGMAVDNFSYDNVIHLSVYEGRTCLFRSNIAKTDFESLIPAGFLSTAVLQSITFLFCDKEGLHFTASVCMPESSSCYSVELCVDYDGNLTQDVRDS